MDHHAIDIEEDTSPAVESGTARSAAGLIGEEAGPVDANARSQNDAVTRCWDKFLHGLDVTESGTERSFQAWASSCTIFRIPEVLRGINPEAEKPELVSIGPYHRGEDRLREFERHKWFFLKSFLRRTGSDGKSLVKLMADEASSALGCYSELQMTSNDNFMEIMLLDGCFVVELLLQIGAEEDARAPILRRQGIIPILIRDLLKLENQVPYSLLQSLFEYSSSTRVEARTPYLSMLALRAFNLVYPGDRALRDKYTDLQYRDYYDIKKRPHDHLLDLFCFTLFPANPDPQNDSQTSLPSDKSIPDKSIPCVTQLRPCGIKFKSKKTERLLDISFRKRVLEIPSIAINDFMVTVLINSIALEQCQENSSKLITDYVSFMRCLINQPKDVSVLCSDGIISTPYHDDHYVFKLFNDLGQAIYFYYNTRYLSNQFCFLVELSKQFKELESYYSSNWGIMMLMYFSRPWTAIKVFSASLALALTAAQTIYTVLGHYSR